MRAVFLCLGVYGACTDLLHRVLEFMVSCSRFRLLSPAHYLNMCSFFFVIAEAKRQLIAAGFHLLKENEKWDLQPGGRYFFTRNMSSLVAFAIGKK